MVLGPLFKVSGSKGFDTMCEEIFRFQYNLEWSDPCLTHGASPSDWNRATRKTVRRTGIWLPSLATSTCHQQPTNGERQPMEVLHLFPTCLPLTSCPLPLLSPSIFISPSSATWPMSVDQVDQVDQEHFAIYFISEYTTRIYIRTPDVRTDRRR